MEDMPLPTHQQLEILARDIATSMASNQSECWARIFYRIGISAPVDWCVRCIWLVESISRHSPVPISPDRRERRVSNQEARNLGFTGTKLSLDACMTLASILSALEAVLGSDHVSIVPVRWEQYGALQRAHALASSKPEEGQWSH